jgi:hypothetical protein
VLRLVLVRLVLVLRLALVRPVLVLRLALVRPVLEPREWVQRQVWALVARVLDMIVKVPKARALARTEAAQLTAAVRAKQTGAS